MFEEKENLKSDQETPEEIHVMPDYLKEKKRPKIWLEKKPKKSFPFWLIWILISLPIIGFAIVFYFQPNLIFSLFTEKERPKLINQPIIVNQPIINQPEVPSPSLVSPEQTIKAELKKDDEIILSAELYLPEGALKSNEKLNLTIDLFEGPEEKYKIVGGLIKTSPLIEILKPLKLKIFYSEKEIESFWEDDLKIGYLRDNFWLILPTEIDIENNILTTDLSSLYSGIFAPLVLKEKTIRTKETQEIAPGIFFAEDTDNDGLTDKEEEIFKTDKNNPDTDNDSFSDGSEIINLYNPLEGSGAKLADSGLVKIYSNETFNYSLFYPEPFLPKMMPESEDKELIISTETGEFFSLVVIDNPEKISVGDWYKKQVKELEPEKFKKTTVDGYEAVWSLDGLTLYFGKEDKIFAFTYNIGAEKKANFKSTFLMMIKSFRFLSE